MSTAALDEMCAAVSRGFTVSLEPYKGQIGVRLFKQEEKAERPELGPHYAKACEIDPQRLDLVLIKMPIDKAAAPIDENTITLDLTQCSAGASAELKKMLADAGITADSAMEQNASHSD